MYQLVPELNEEKPIRSPKFASEEAMDMNPACETLKEGKILRNLLFLLILKHVICLFHMLHCILFELNMSAKSTIFSWLAKKGVFESAVIFLVFSYRIACLRNKQTCQR